MNKPFILTCDTSNFAIAYILSQKGEDGLEHVIEYGGHSLRKGEVNYSVTEKEALGVVEGFKHYHTYLYGSETTVVTDHSALTYIAKNNKNLSRVTRWSLVLQNYNYQVIHCAGSKLTNADALSRLQSYPQEPGAQNDLPLEFDICQLSTQAEDTLCQGEKLEYELFSVDTNDMTQFDRADYIPQVSESVMHIQQVDMAELQDKCEHIGSIYRYIKNGTLPKDRDRTRSILHHEDEYGLREGVLFHVYYPRSRNAHRFSQGIHQLVLPKDLRPEVLQEYHDSLAGGGHMGFERTHESIRQRYYWPGVDTESKSYVSSCEQCQKAKHPHLKHPPLNPLPPTGLFGRMHIDFIGPCKTSSDGKKYILLVVDAFSRWSEAFPLESADAISVAQVLYREIFTRYGCPGTIISDRGTHFVNSLIEAVCHIFGIRRSKTSAYHPQTNSACERYNSFIHSSLKTYVDDSQSDWPKYLPGIMMAFRRSPATKATEFSPFFLLFGQHMNSPIDKALLSQTPDVAYPYRNELKSIIDNVQLARQVAAENNARHQQYNKTHHDKTAKDPDYKIGDLVWLFDPRVPVGVSRKWRPQWVGPYHICELGPHNTYRLRHALTHRVTDTLVNASRLKTATHQDESVIRQHHHRQ